MLKLSELSDIDREQSESPQEVVVNLLMVFDKGSYGRPALSGTSHIFHEPACPHMSTLWRHIVIQQ